MAKAYILVLTEVSKAGRAADDISQISGVISAKDVTGPYDVVVEAEGPSISDIHSHVLRGIQKVPGITRTLTCPVISF